MENIEYSICRRKENPAQRFLQRIKDAESRGFKPNGSITEATLRAFESRGVNPGNKTAELSEKEKRLDRERTMIAIKLEAERIKRLDEEREKRLDEIRNRMKNEKAVPGIQMNTEKKTNYIYL